MNIDLNNFEKFENRHNNTHQAQVAEMLQKVNAESLEALIDDTVPASIRMQQPLQLPEAMTEQDFLAHFKEVASKNKQFKSYLGMGYYPCHTPNVILRNILENPAWYTAYTPYQAEIAQGRLEMLINFQTMVSDLTGMDIANASLLDEGTAAAEAMFMMHAINQRKKKGADRFFISDRCHPQTIDILKTRAIPQGIDLVIGSLEALDLTDPKLFGILLQYPDTEGYVTDFDDLIGSAHDQKVLVAMAADLLALTQLKSPGEMGADVVVGSSQRFGVPMGYGGPHAAFFATREDYKRLLPGRIIGVSKDVEGNLGYRMALQTREQHIRREKATSNICTAQVLLAVMSAAYAVYHGPAGLRNIGLRVHGMARLFAMGMEQLGLPLAHQAYFDTLKVKMPTEIDCERLKSATEARAINLRYFSDSSVGIAFDETTQIGDVVKLVELFAEAIRKPVTFNLTDMATAVEVGVPTDLQRQSEWLTHPVFHTYRSEHEMLRYLKSLENKDLSLVHSMISLGSCTMKLNATTEMIPVTWPEMGNMHPFAPLEQTAGYQEIFKDLEQWLCEITGFEAVSLQPNSGAQGEYAGLMVIRAYHEHRNEPHRNIALIPSSAHGTNPASAVMAGMKVVIVQCDALGNIDIEDLRKKAEQYQESLASLMVTYPSTHGVFEEGIKEICDIVHQHGGMVYMDGANMNAQVGVTSPALIGADVCHLNLHKTFCIPHGGGGPGMGPIGVNAALAPFLPGHSVVDMGKEHAITSVSAAPWGSASILAISYAYIAMMGGDGLTRATQIAILNANYIGKRLDGHYPILFSGKNGRNAHEMIIDCRDFKKAGIEVEDIAKRLMDYGFHAPTVSFPVPGTMMIEPTESETLPELDRFCDALIAIRTEIQEVIDGKADAGDNVLKNAPHTAAMVMAESWERPYSREKAAFPLSYVKENKFWPSIRRIDSAFGDRNLMCSCIPVTEYQEETSSAEESAV